MPLSLRAAALRTALERALDEPVHALTTSRGTRVHAPAPPPHDAATWGAVFDALRSADYYGSTDTSGTPEIWAEIQDEATS
ncbi:hypothetical protein ACFWFF_01645 [Streptomyces sp. NPDC060223]|uniref:hypothetical protein n=1 Tax=unclassified Streptomyces TaxID=2593676 RepID=UPI00362DACA9